MTEEFQVKKVYEPLQGRFIKEVKASDILIIDTGGTIGPAGSTVAQSNISAYFDYYVTNLYAWSTGTVTLSIQSATSTIASFNVYGMDLIINTSRETPICKISGAATCSLGLSAKGTVCAWISGVREPKFAYVETV